MASEYQIVLNWGELEIQLGHQRASGGVYKTCVTSLSLRLMLTWLRIRC